MASVGETSTLRQAAFFDLDKTVIAKASMMAFGRPFYREGLIGRRTIVRGIYAQLVYLHLGASEQKLARIRESVLTLTRGWEQARVRSIVRETLEAVIEPILFEEALELIPRPDGGFDADARISLDDFKQRTGIDLSFEEIGEDVDTLGGVVVAALGRVPARGEIVSHAGFEFEILEADPRRVKRLRIRAPRAAQAATAS